MELQVAAIKILFFLEVSGSEGFFVRFSNVRGFVVLICLPEDNADLVVGKILRVEYLYVLVVEIIAPAVAVMVFNPLSVIVKYSITVRPSRL